MEIKSKLVQCSRGHYYNGALHDTCPVCKNEGGGAAVGRTEPAIAPAPDPAPMNFGGGVMSGTISAGDQQNVIMGAVNSGDPFAPTQDPHEPSADMSQTMVDIDDEDSEVGFDPVVGWLICIEGTNKGKDFRIRNGYNYIGRESGDIVIPDDRHISRQNHAMVAYDSNDDVYYVGPSNGRNLIKVNGRTLFNATELHNFDVLSIGSTKLMFLGLCGEQFNWNRGR